MPVRREAARCMVMGNGPRTPPRQKVGGKRADGRVNTRMLWALVDRGLSTRDVAEEMGVSRETVRYHLKKRQRQTCELVVAGAAGPVVERQLNTIDQLHRINEDANKLLARAMEGVRALEGVDVNEMGMVEAVEVVRAITAGKDVALKAMAEIRGQLKLQLEIFQALYDVRAAEEFQQEVLKAIGEVDEPTRNRILDRIRQRRAVRQVVQPN